MTTVRPASDEVERDRAVRRGERSSSAPTACWDGAHWSDLAPGWLGEPLRSSWDRIAETLSVLVVSTAERAVTTCSTVPGVNGEHPVACQHGGRRVTRSAPDDAGSRPWRHHPVSLFPVGERWHHLVAEIGRFMAVGGIATFVSFVIFNFLVHGLYVTSDPWLGGHPITAFIIANFVGMVISYRLSRVWTFRHRPPVHADGGRTAYFVINTATMVIPVACLLLTRRVFGLDDPVSDNLSGNVVGQLLGQVVRFYLFRTYVFQKPADEPVLPLRYPAGGATGPSTSGRAQPPAP